MNKETRITMDENTKSFYEEQIKIIANLLDLQLMKDYPEKCLEMMKNLKEQNKILEKALELICDYMEYDYFKQNDDIWYRKSKDLEMYFKNKAKELLEDE